MNLSLKAVNYTNSLAAIDISSSEEFFLSVLYLMSVKFFNEIVLIYSLKMYKFSSNIGMNNLGAVLWENVGCLTVVYIICYFSMWKGVKTSGKVSQIFRI